MEFNLQTVQAARDTPGFKRTIMAAAAEGRSGCALSFTDKLEAESAHKELVTADFECSRLRTYNERDGTDFGFNVEW